MRIQGAVQGIGGGGPPADDGDAQSARGGGIPLRHADGGVLVPRSVKTHTDRVQCRDEHGRVVAHEPEYIRVAAAAQIVGQGLVNRHLAGGCGVVGSGRVRLLHRARLLDWTKTSKVGVTGQFRARRPLSYEC